jgi:hypothetical protein
LLMVVSICSVCCLHGHFLCPVRPYLQCMMHNTLSYRRKFNLC